MEESGTISPPSLITDAVQRVLEEGGIGAEFSLGADRVAAALLSVLRQVIDKDDGSAAHPKRSQNELGVPLDIDAAIRIEAVKGERRRMSRSRSSTAGVPRANG